MPRQRRKKGRPVHGILLLDKPSGISSNQALQRVKYLFKAQKAGHTGSLDPLATGMLPICFGEATKTSRYLLNSDKSYQTTLTLGITTDSGDAEGNVLEKQPVPELTQRQIEDVLSRFTGEIEQIPPMYSALKHQGKPLYELARQGIDIERKARRITITQNRLLEQKPETLTLQVDCSKGTYIRSLAMDIGDTLGCGAHVSMLRRTRVAPFLEERMFTMEELQQAADSGALDDHLLPEDAGIVHMPKIDLDERAVEELHFGRSVPQPDSINAGELVRLYGPDEQLLGIGETSPDQQIRPVRLIHPPE